MLKEGWKWLLNSPKYHYFLEDGKSICKRWMAFSMTDLSPDDAKLGKNDCKACRRKLDKRIVNSPPPPQGQDKEMKI